MKRITILAVGKIKEKYLNDGINEYLKRLTRFCDIKIIEVNDVEFSDAEKSIATQSDLILAKIKGYCILLDIKGQSLDSKMLADKVESIYTLGYDTITFIIGGSNGVDERVKSAANLALSFGAMTFPHQLMRLVLTEQIYRAFNITANTPYHK